MAVTITQAEATVAIRAATSIDMIPAPVQTVVTFLFKAAAVLVQDNAPEAPDDLHNVALVRLLGWLYDADPTDSRIARAFEVSGAAGLLAPWRVQRAGIVQSGEAAVTPAPTPSGGGANLPPVPGPGSWVLINNNGVLTWVAFPLPPA